MLETLVPDESLYGLGFGVRYRGEVEMEQVRRSLNQVVAAHPMLRARIEIENGRPVHVVEPASEVDLQVESAVGLSVEEVRERVNGFVRQVYDLRRGPLTRFLGLELGADDRLLIIATHHLVSDLWSLALLGSEIAEAFDPTPSERRRPTRQRDFATFVTAEAEHLASEKGRSSIDFWRSSLRGRSSVIDLAPLSQPGTLPGRAVRHPVEVDRSVAQKWSEAAADLGCSLHDLLLAGYTTLLYRYTGESEVTVGTYRANRSPRDLETIGCFRSLAAWTFDVDGGVGLTGLLHEVASVVAQARAHQRVSLRAAILDEVQAPGLSGIALPAFFQWRKTTRRVDPGAVSAFGAGRGAVGGDETAELSIGGLTLEAISVDLRADADITLEVYEHDDSLELVFVYDENRHRPAAVDRMGQHLIRLVSAAVDEPTRAIAELPMLTDAEEASLEASWRGPSVDHGEATTIVSAVQDGLAKRPDEVVARQNERALTARDFDDLARRYEGVLRAAGVEPGNRVGLHLRPSLDLSALAFAVLRLGATYVGLPTDAPLRRLEQMVTDALVGLAVTSDGSDALREGPGSVDGIVW
ncbi:MAG: condensation domain-containing protein, partial [Actinomycetota bacterium]